MSAVFMDMGVPSIPGNPSSHVRGAIFDLDGTLLDSMHVWEDIDRRFLGKRGIACPDDYAEALKTMEFRGAAIYTVQRFCLDEDPEDIMREWSEMSRRIYAEEISLKPGAGEYLEVLSSYGVRMGVATSAVPELFVPALRRNGIYGFFSAFAMTSEVSRGKNFPDVYLLAAERLGLNPGKCAVYEDTLAGISGAAAGGFVTVGVYDRSSSGDWAEIKGKAQFSVEGFDSIR